MNREKRRVFFFLTLLGGSLLLCDRLLVFGFRRIQRLTRSGDHGGRIQNVLQGRVRPYLLLVGSSRMEYTVDPEFFPYPTYNLGHAGYEIYWANGVLGLIEEAGRLPPAVLLELDLEAFLPDKNADADTLHDRRFLRTLWRRGNWVDRQAREWPLLDRLKFLSALYPFNGQFFYLLRDWLHPLPDTSHGFSAFAAEPGDSLRVIRLERKSEKRHPYFPRSAFPVSRSHLQMLSDLAGRLKSQGVFLAAFTAPEFRNDGSLEYVAQSVDSVLERYGVPYLDFYGLPAWHDDDAGLYKDPGHVNAAGAVLATKIVVHWLAHYLPEGRHPGKP